MPKESDRLSAKWIKTYLLPFQDSPYIGEIKNGLRTEDKRIALARRYNERHFGELLSRAKEIPAGELNSEFISLNAARDLLVHHPDWLDPAEIWGWAFDQLLFEIGKASESATSSAL
jgi:hypothetical protein